MRPHLDGLSDVIEHCATGIIIGMANPNPRMGQITRTHGRSSRTFGGEVRGEDPWVVLCEHFFASAIARYMAVLAWSQGDQSCRKAAAWAWGGLAEHQRTGPFGIEVKVVGVIVEIPQAASGGTCADLAKGESFVADKPFHVGCGGAELKEVDHALAKMTKRLITR